MSTQVHPATPTEGKTTARHTATASTGSGEATVTSLPVSVYKDVFECPDYFPKDLFAESLQLSQEGIQRNRFNHYRDGDDSTVRPPCHHDRVSPWKLLEDPPAAQCADCKAELGAARLSEELRKAKVAEDQDSVSTQTRHDPRFAIRADVLLLFALR